MDLPDLSAAYLAPPLVVALVLLLFAVSMYKRHLESLVSQYQRALAAMPRRCAADERVADLESVLLVRNAAIEEMSKKIALLEDSLDEESQRTKEKEMLNVKVDAYMYGLLTTVAAEVPDPDPEKTAKLLAAGRACIAASLQVPADILRHFGGKLPAGDAATPVEKVVPAIWDAKDTPLPNGHKYNLELKVPPGATSIRVEFCVAAKINPTTD